ncbi:fungal-specific transcription factor domain-containing protein [Aspergillus pseudoustus]|uniref:Fungal-specific transcription factor domain-containing protein n=1 Tax=Aspergillus pseudoustus TaxID=1810923 RepID=A0ABR4JZ01_9EURO
MPELGRRRRCSEDRPACSGCLKRGISCHYGIRLLWQDDAESLGIAFGRAHKKDRRSASGDGTEGSMHPYFARPARRPTHRYWLNTTCDELSLLYGGPSAQQRPSFEMDESEPVLRQYPRSVIPVSLSLCPSLVEVDRFLFHYFGSICTSRRSLIGYENPWRSVLLPLCYESEGLLHIAIAWAAHTLRNQCEERDVSRFEQSILVHKCRSLKYLRNMVPQNSNDTAVILARAKGERDALLLLVMFHCLLEIASGSIEEWTYHMRGALLIMKFYTNMNTTSWRDTFSEEVVELVYTFFIEKGTFLGTTVNTAYDLDWSTEVPSMFPFLAGRGSMKVNPCLGLSTALLDIISSISHLAWQRRKSSLTPRTSLAQSVAQEFTSLRQRLTHLERAPDGDQMRQMSLISTAFVEATWIYLHHAVGNQPRHSDIIQKTHLPRLLATLERIHSIQGPLLGFIPYPMWALFIASCVVLEDDRVRILGWFTVLKCNKPISNVPSTMAAVEAIWRRRDLEVDDRTTAQYAAAQTLIAVGGDPGAEQRNRYHVEAIFRAITKNHVFLVRQLVNEVTNLENPLSRTYFNPQEILHEGHA